MEILSEYVWQKYEIKLAEIERKIARKTATLSGDAWVSGSVLDHNISSITSNPVIEEPSAVFDEIEKRSDSILAENRNLQEEVKFLKFEISVVEKAKNELFRLRVEKDNAGDQKDSEIARLFAKNERLEEEISSLRKCLQRRTYSVLEGAVRKHHHRRVAGEGPSILGWLSKPLIVVESK